MRILEQLTELLSVTEKIETKIIGIAEKYLPPNYPSSELNFNFLRELVDDRGNRGALYGLLDHTSITFSIKSSKRICDKFFKSQIFKITECSLDQVRYGDEICVVKPSYIPNCRECCTHELATIHELWQHSIVYAEDHFTRLLASDVSLEDAKDILPLSIRLEIIVTGSLKDWIDYFYSVELDEEIDPDFKELNSDLVYKISEHCPNIIDSICTERENRI